MKPVYWTVVDTDLDIEYVFETRDEAEQKTLEVRAIGHHYLLVTWEGDRSKLVDLA